MQSEIPATTIEISKALTEDHEGRRNGLYRDTEGHLTIGVGHNLDRNPLPDEVVDLLYSHDLAAAVAVAARYEYFSSQNPPRQAALIDMAFQLGGNGFSKFKKMHAALSAGQYDTAAAEALDSRYAEQTPSRAQRIALIIQTGKIEK